MNISKMNDLMSDAESRLGATHSNDPMYDYLRGKRDGIAAVMGKLGYRWKGEMSGFRKDRDDKVR